MIGNGKSCLFQNRNCIGDSFFKSFSSVFINLCFVFFTVGKATCTADTSADTSHTFNEVCLKCILTLLKERNSAFLYAVTGDGVKLKISYILLFNCLSYSISKTTATCKNSSEIRSIIKNTLFKSCDINITAVKECLKFFEG